MANRSSSHSNDCCLWDGVMCNEETGHVIGLDLSSSCLYGTFPHNSSLFSLDHLEELDLSDNHFNFSKIPSAIGRLSKLTELNLSQSFFMGSIPTTVSKLSSLKILDLSRNYNLELQYEMTFEKFVENLTQITTLHLEDVNISSSVPVVLSNFTSLQSLILIENHLFGTFPSRVFQLPKLEVIILDNNDDLEGNLPEFPPNSPLKKLKIATMSFSGEITPSIGNLGNLTGLSLESTGLTGPIPSSLGNLTKLSFLMLRCNFNGDLPLSITNLTQLTTLLINNFYIHSLTLNYWLPKLKNLENLGLKNVTLTGEIPTSLSNLTRFSRLDLSFNKLTGPLPLWLANKTTLVYLNLYGNKFQTPIIPQWFSQLLNLKTLLLSSDGSVAMFETLLKLPYLRKLELSGINLTFPPLVANNNLSSLPNFETLVLESCNLTEFPQFLRTQNELQFLDITGNDIVGTIPQWFVNKTTKSLIGLSLSGNYLTGFEQPQTMLPWYNLEVLYLSDNNFQGKLLSPPTSLQYYQVSRNKLYGVIPNDICMASSMIFLDLSMNNFSGKIPVCIAQQLSASLAVLNLRGNRLEGPIPQTFSTSCKIKMISLSNNHLNGRLPKSLANCGLLEVIDVGRNELRDTFPSWLGSLQKLQVLVLRHNKFHGMIAAPRSGHSFSCLRVIDLSNNFHAGSLPSTYLQNWQAMKVTDEVHHEYSSSSDLSLSLSDSGLNVTSKVTYTYVMTITNKGSERFYSAILTVFRAIDLSSNNFTGEIPNIMGNLIGIQALNLSNNHLTGGIPSSLANMIDLEALDLSQNMLSGDIPLQLIKVTSLEIFNVSHNHLEGPIPQGKQFNTFDNSSFVGNLALCGPPLSNQCGESNAVPPAKKTADETEQDSELIHWIIPSMGCVAGCIVGFIIGKIFITDPYHDWFMKTFERRKALKPRPN
ncbi:unnamed protein product [Amaranthus hypochondriacus]